MLYIFWASIVEYHQYNSTSPVDRTPLHHHNSIDFTAPTLFYYTKTAPLHHHHKTLLHKTPLYHHNSSQLDFTITTPLYHHNSTQLDSTKSTPLHHHNSVSSSLLIDDMAWLQTLPYLLITYYKTDNYLYFDYFILCLCTSFAGNMFSIQTIYGWNDSRALMETVFQGHTKIALTVKLGHETSLAQFSRSLSQGNWHDTCHFLNPFLQIQLPPSLITLPCWTLSLIFNYY